MPFEKPFTVPAPGRHTHTLIFLHGRGDKASTFGPFFNQDLRNTASLQGLKIIFPTPASSFSTEWRRQIRQWFDFSHKTGVPLPKHGLETLREVVEYIVALIDAEDVPSENVLLGGLSQGTAVALMVLLLGGRKVGGVIGMSGWCPFADQLTSGDGIARLGALRQQIMHLPPLRDSHIKDILTTPIWLGHGDADDVVRYEVGEQMCTALRALGMDVQWTRYPGLNHWYQVPESFEGVVKFWEKCTPGLVR